MRTSTFGTGPPIPPRTSSEVKADADAESGNSWRQALAVALLFLLGVALVFSTITLFRYAFRDKRVYDELVDYIDKTISISKINYNRDLGFYEITENEKDALHHQKRYKTLIWSYLASDLVIYIFLASALMLYYGSDASRGAAHVAFWLLFGFLVLYAIIESAVFTGLLLPLTNKLPNETTTLLDHAIPHNPGGLIQMEQGLGCTFDLSLYDSFKRRHNPNDTCDPYIASSYIPSGLLIAIVVTRLIALAIFVLLILLRNSIGGVIADLISRTCGGSGRHGRFVKNPNYSKSTPFGSGPTPKSTTFGIKDNRPISDSHPPPTPPALIDHSISYNNAAFIATGGGGLNSSRSSEISADFLQVRPKQPASVVSEV